MSLVDRFAPRLPEGGPALRGYLLGRVDCASALAVQRALAGEVVQGREAALVLCEHPPAITVGRHGNPSQIHFDLDDLRTWGWPVRWVSRGGGCFLHLPGQLAVYPVFPLDRLGLDVEAYLGRLHEVLLALLADFGVRGELRPGCAGVWVAGRPIAAVGVAIRHWVSSFGVALNVNPDLIPFRQMDAGAPGDGPMTSLARERGGNLRPALVRQRLLGHFADRFRFGRLSLFFNHPLLRQHERLTWEAEERAEWNGR